MMCISGHPPQCGAVQGLDQSHLIDQKDRSVQDLDPELGQENLSQSHDPEGHSQGLVTGPQIHHNLTKSPTDVLGQNLRHSQRRDHGHSLALIEGHHLNQRKRGQSPKKGHPSRYQGN